MKSIEKSDCSLLISPIAFSSNKTFSSAYVRGKKRVQTASMRKRFLDLARSERTLNSAWLSVAGCKYVVLLSNRSSFSMS